MSTLKTVPYLTMDGTCREAMNFYQKCIGGELQVMDFEGAPMDIPEGSEKRVMHANLINGEFTLFASDSMPGQPVVMGTSVTISVNCESPEQLDKLYGSLGQGGTQSMKPEKTFWGAYFGMLTDKFGFHWMFNYDYPKN